MEAKTPTAPNETDCPGAAYGRRAAQAGAPRNPDRDPAFKAACQDVTATERREFTAEWYAGFDAVRP